MEVAAIREQAASVAAGRSGGRLASTDVARLAAELRSRVRGEVRFDEGSRALYATDASNYRQVPIGVVVPRDATDVAETVAACRAFGAPVLARGGGTSLAGQTCNVAVVIDMSKYMRGVLSIDAGNKQARVQPGVVLDQLRAAAEQHGLTFGPDPATHNRCTLGGMIGNNSCGVHSVMAGKTDDNVEQLEILTYDGTRLQVGATGEDELARIIADGGRRGEIYRALRELRDRYAPLIRARYPDIPRRVSGYNLPWLLPENGFQVARALVGSEGTCVTVTEATLRLVDSPPARVLLVLGYDDLYRGCDQIPRMLEHKPVGLEGFDERLVDDLRKKNQMGHELSLLPPGQGWLLVEFGAGRAEDAAAQARGLMDALTREPDRPHMKLLTQGEQVAAVWQVRESALGATANVPGERPGWPGWEDSAVPPEKIGRYLHDLRALIDRYDYRGSFYGHFGQGCLHTRLDFGLRNAAGIDQFRRFLDEASDLVLRYGGSFSGEHGDGQARAELLPKMFGEELVQAFREFKAIWDPENRMNPGKVVEPYRIVENLRLGVTYDPPPVTTRFKFPSDDHSFSQASLRCVGVGKCRRTEGGTMCPSYMVTLEEEHSTRGRARLLFEMLQGDPLAAGWRDQHVREALDLCLACKGCKGECPVNVDMATYKAEFLSHYYAGRLRPVAAYSMGLIYWWARLARHAPRLVNTLLRAPFLGGAFRRLGGLAPERQVPAFASQTFKEWFQRRGERNAGRPPVILWPDTFNNHFHPHTAQAAVEVLESAGFQVLVPKPSLCCGRPLYDWGMLDLAERLLRQTLEELGPQIRAGVPLVGLEPSCMAVFRDELVNLLPDDENARRLSGQSYLLSEFLARKAGDYRLPELVRPSGREGAADHPRALVHAHCHHQAIFGLEDEKAVLDALGLDFRVLDSGCCGMAGSFGFERGERYEVSIKAGERVLLPAVRSAAADTLIISDGFSCREQIAQGTDRRALHLAEVLQMALHDGQRVPAGSGDGRQGLRPEDAVLPSSSPAELPAAAAAGLVLLAGAGLLGWAAAWRRSRRGH